MVRMLILLLWTTYEYQKKKNTLEFVTLLERNEYDGGSKESHIILYHVNLC